MIMRRGAAPKKVGESDLVEPSTVRARLWSVCEHSKQATQAVRSPTRGTFGTKTKMAPSLTERVTV